METTQPPPDDSSVVPPSADAGPPSADPSPPSSAGLGPPSADPGPSSAGLGPPSADPGPPSAGLGPPSGRGDAGPWSQPDVDLPRVRVSGPADMLAVVPHLLGFHPRLSFVVIGAGGARQRVDIGFRYDLPDPP